MSILLVGTLDTKGVEYGHVRDLLRTHGSGVILVDAGVHAPQLAPDIGNEEVFGRGDHAHRGSAT